jgi:1,4-dihydroxy-2-naphthoate octaprenyltransferase
MNTVPSSVPQKAPLWQESLRTLGRFLASGLALVAPLLLLLAWEALVRGDVRLGRWVLWRFEPVFSPAFFARPSEIGPELLSLYEDGTLMKSVWASTVRVLLGFTYGAVPAVVLGLMMGSFPLLRALFAPLAEALYAIPKIALLPLVLFIYGAGEEAMIRMVALSVFFLMLLSIYKGVEQIDPKYYEIARSFGASRWGRFFSVTLPASMPTLVSSVQLGMGFALVVIVGSEFLAGGAGVGSLIWKAKESFRVVEMFAGLVVVGVMGYVSALILGRAARLTLPWMPQPRPKDPTALQQMAQKFWVATRPWSFTATYVPILVGSSIAAYELAQDGRTFNWLYFALALVGATAFQAGTNLVNDYYDHVKGADKPTSLGIGGAIQRGEFSPRFILFYGLACFIVGSIIGLYLVSVAGEFILILGVLSLLAGFFYTASPYALAYIGLGEVTVGVFMGPVIVLGANYVQTGAVSLLALANSLPIAFTVAAILHLNNLRDIETDKAVGKRTLASLLGREKAIVEYQILTLGAYVLLAGLVLVGYAPLAALLVFISLPSALALVYRVMAKPDPLALNPVLRQSAQLHLRFGLLLAVGWAYAMLNLSAGL